MRDLSKYKSLRIELSKLYPSPSLHLNGTVEHHVQELEKALYFSMMITYAQGMHMMAKASVQYDFHLNLASIAKIWRGGCIIRSSFLHEIYNAYEKNSGLEHLLLDPEVQKLIDSNITGIRTVLGQTIQAGLSFSAFSSALSYFDSFRTGRLPSNLIQAQRDYFGAHTYEIIGKEGVFHTQWIKK